MVRTRHLTLLGILGLLAPLGCGATDGTEPVGMVSSPAIEAKCGQSDQYDMLIADLMHASLKAKFSLTQLYADGEGIIQGPEGMPEAIQGQLDLINQVPEAQADVASALEKVSGEPVYTILGDEFYAEACTDVPAWTPDGPTTINTHSVLVHPGNNSDSWRNAHKEFGKVCPLIKRNADADLVDPPGDGSTNLPSSSTVSVTGVVANAYGLCPVFAPIGTYCKLSYATGINWTGRKCQLYTGYKRCLLY